MAKKQSKICTIKVPEGSRTTYVRVGVNGSFHQFPTNVVIEIPEEHYQALVNSSHKVVESGSRGSEGGDGEGSPSSLFKMTIKQLRQLAAKHNVQLEGDDNKSDIVRKINDKLAEG